MKSLGAVERFASLGQKRMPFIQLLHRLCRISIGLLICSLVLQKQIFLGNQTTLSLELVVTAIVSHIVMLCVCKWTVSGGCVLNF